MKKSFEIQVPFFPGFYESIFENCDTEYFIVNEEIQYLKDSYDLNDNDINEDDIVFDYKKRRIDIAKMFVNVFAENAPSGLLEKCEFSEIVSPRYYNYSTDRIYANIELSDDWETIMRDFIDKNYDWLDEKIKDDWTDYDGFISFIKNDIKEWDNMLFNEDREDYIASMIAYMMLKENKNIRDVLCEWTYDNISDIEYISYSDSLKEKINAVETKRENDVIFNKLQLKLDFTD